MTILRYLALWCVASVAFALMLGALIGRADFGDEWTDEDA